MIVKLLLYTHSKFLLFTEVKKDAALAHTVLSY